MLSYILGLVHRYPGPWVLACGIVPIVVSQRYVCNGDGKGYLDVPAKYLLPEHSLYIYIFFFIQFDLYSYRVSTLGAGFPTKHYVDRVTIHNPV